MKQALFSLPLDIKCYELLRTGTEDLIQIWAREVRTGADEPALHLILFGLWWEKTGKVCCQSQQLLCIPRT